MAMTVTQAYRTQKRLTATECMLPFSVDAWTPKVQATRYVDHARGHWPSCKQHPSRLLVQPAAADAGTTKPDPAWLPTRGAANPVRVEGNLCTRSAHEQ
eukprot:506105-Rhodomonas_salina.1